MLDQLLYVISLVAWVWFVLFVVMIIWRAYQVGGLNQVLKKIFSVRVFIALLIAVGLSLLSSSLVFIEPPEVGVVISLLQPDGYRQQPLRSGLHFIVPLAERVIKYPIYWQTYTMSMEPTEGAKTGNDSIAARTSDGQAVYIDCSVIYRIDANEAIRVHIDLQNRYVEDFIRPVIRGLVRTEVSQFTADEVNSSKRKDLESSLDEILRTTFSAKGFVLDRFLLRNISFSQAYSSAIEQKQVAEQDQIQREYQAEQMRKLSQGKADATVIEAKGEAQATLLKADAESKALKLIADALKLNKDLITYRYVDKLSPGIRVMLVPNNNPYILPLPDLSSALGAGANTAPTMTITSTLGITNTLTPTPTPSPSPTR